MKDRLPTKPNRKKITFEDDHSIRYATVEYADEPTEEGSRINKELLLKDDTASLLGLSGSNATPNNAFKTILDRLDTLTNWVLNGADVPFNKSQTFTSNGTFKVPVGVTQIQVHLVGGGGGGGNTPYTTKPCQYALSLGYMGGGGGYTKTVKINVTPLETLSITVGAGGAPGNNGSASSIRRGSSILAQANGGISGNTGGAGGSGGGGPDCFITIKTAEYYIGGAGGTNGSDGSNGDAANNNIIGPTELPGGMGQGTTTRDWGDSKGTLRAQGGAGGGVTATPSKANSGNGGNGKTLQTKSTYGVDISEATPGDKGIVLIRWAGV